MSWKTEYGLRARFQGLGAGANGGPGGNDPTTLFGLPLDPSISGGLPDGYVLTWNAIQGYWTAKASTSVSPSSPSATAGPVAVNGSAATYMRSDAAPAVQKASASQFGIVQVDGSSITSSSGVISATGFVPAAAVFHPGMRSGVYYGTPAPGSTGTRTLTSGRLVALPFFCPFSATFTKIGINVTGNIAASHCELGVYANSNGVPGALLLDAGQIDSSTTGFKTITGLTLTLAPGWYFLAIAPSAASIVVTSLLLDNLAGWLLGNTGGGVMTASNYDVAWTYSTGNLPNPYGTANGITTSTPYVVLGF